MKKLLLALVALLIIPASFAACLNDDDRIFQISGTTNAHAELWNQTNYREPAGVEICYSEVFGGAYSGAVGEHECTIGGNTFLMGSGSATSLPTNMHVEELGQGNYIVNKICYGDLACNYRGSPGNPEPCQPGEECVVTISDVTNAHLATCSDPNAYDIKVCCSSAGTVPAGLTADAGGPYACTLQQLSETGSMACGVVLDGSGSSNPNMNPYQALGRPCIIEGPTMVCQFDSDTTTGADDVFVDHFAPSAQYGDEDNTFVYKNNAPLGNGEGETLFRLNEIYSETTAAKIQLALYHLESWVYGDSFWPGHPNEVRINSYLVNGWPEEWDESTVSWSTKPGNSASVSSQTVVSSASAENKCNRAFVPCDDLAGEHWVYFDITDAYYGWMAYEGESWPGPSPGLVLKDIDGDYAHSSGLAEASGNKFASSENPDPSKRPKVIFSNGIEFQWLISNHPTDDDPQCEIIGASDAVNPIVSCAHVGTAIATLRVSSGASQDEDTSLITVTALGSGTMPPSAEAYGPYFGDEGVSISLTGQCFDGDGAIASCQWSSSSMPAGCSFNQLPAGIGTSFASNNGSVQCNGIPNSVSFPITLTATDNDSLTGSDSTTVSVTGSVSGNMPPFAEASGPYSGNAANPGDPATIGLSGQCFDLDGTVSSCGWSHDGGAECSILQNPANIGTGSATNNGSITCTFAADATVTVTLTAEDDFSDTGTDNALVEITVGGSGPSCVSLTAAPDSGTGPFSSTLTASFQNVADGTNIDFDCGNGQTGVGTVVSNLASFACNYGPVGSLTTYTATADDGASIVCPQETVANNSGGPGPGPGTGFLKIVQLTAEPAFFESSAQKQFSNVKVALKNTGTAAISPAEVKLFAKVAETNQPIGLGLLGSNQAPINAGAAREFTFSNVDIVAAGNDLASGSYKLVAEAYDSGTKTDSKSVYFTVGSQIPVPETPLFLAALIALSVVLIALFSRKKS